MLNNPALQNPQTVLHILDYRAVLPILLAFLMPDCPRPASTKWLMRRVGKSRTTVEESLAFLEEYLLARHTPPYGWQLTDNAYQLPLPFKQLRPGAQPAAVIEVEPGPYLESMSGAQPTPYPQAVDNFDSENRPGASPAGSDHLCSQNVSNAYILRMGGYGGDGGGGVNSSHPETKHHHHSEATAMRKIYASGGEFLAAIGMNPPVPRQYADCDPALALAYWWFARAENFDRPHGYLRRRLEQGHVQPGERGPALPGLLALAAVWPQLDSDDRRELRQAAGGTQNGVYHPPVANGRQLRYQLGDDFYPELDAAALDAYLYLVTKAPEEVTT